MGNIPIENSNFYLENGKVVFTEEHHIKRGFCCQSKPKKCRHCPYPINENISSNNDDKNV
jgi:hypothetical protein